MLREWLLWRLSAECLPHPSPACQRLSSKCVNACGGAEQCPLCADFLISDEMIASKEETARGTLRHLADKYGGARGYARAIGLSDAEVRSSPFQVLEKAPVTCQQPRLAALDVSYPRGCRETLQR